MVVTTMMWPSSNSSSSSSRLARALLLLPALVLVFAAALGGQAPVSAVMTCNRQPYNTHSEKTPGDNGYKIKISGSPEKYVPGEVYTVSLQGWRTHYSVQKFIGFMLVVDGVASSYSNLYGVQSVGTFQLYGDVLTMHSDDCPNAVVHTSNSPKSEIQVLWTAPPAGSGCVRFRGMVQETRETWYMDDGELTKELCEEVLETFDLQPETILDCCACDEAKYEVTFEGLWSRQTHPKDFPANEWLTHFSDIIGASHSDDYRVWEYGGFASDGLRQVAEWGSTRILESELKRQSDHIRTIIKARGLWYPNVTGKTFAVFRVDNRHHLMSLVSMLGPSPDWIVGVSAMELCLKNCTWLDQKTLNLYPWDAGTDSGITYGSANQATIPRQRITKITNSYPNNEQSPFYDPRGLPMKPLARLTITRQRVYEKSCSDTGLLDNEEDRLQYSDEDALRPECGVTQWTEFSACSATCGKGLRMRSRSYLMPMKADMMQCNRQLEEKEMCAASISFCEGAGVGNFFGPSNYVSSDLFLEKFDESICAMSSWSPWSACSVTCGEGFIMRNRHYLDRMGRKKCNEELVQKEFCSGSLAECPESEDIGFVNNDPTCAVAQWSEWSPCSVTCDPGVQVRTRLFLVPSDNKDHCGVETMAKRPCHSGRDCAIDQSEAGGWDGQVYKIGPNGVLEADCSSFMHLNLSIHDKYKFQHWCRLGKERRARVDDNLNEVCKLDKEMGPCPSHLPRWYYDKEHQRCAQFIYGGCRGNRNNFERYSDCTRVCETSAAGGYDALDTSVTHNEGYNQYHNQGVGRSDYNLHDEHSNSPSASHQRAGLTSHSHVSQNHVRAPRVNCVVSEWSDWSPCSTTCGRGRKEKRRMIKVQPQNGGRACPRKLVRRRICRNERCTKFGYNGLESMSLTFESEYSNPLAPPEPGAFSSGGPSAPMPENGPTQDPDYEFELEYDGNHDSDCVMGDWSAWSPCTQSCGPEALQQRARSVVSKPRGSGAQCGARLERRYCTLPPCPHNRG